MKKQLLLIFIISAFTVKSQYWQRNGNPSGGPSGVFPPNNNFLGSQTGNTNWIQFGVNGNQDIFIDNLNGAPQLLPATGGGNPQGGHWVGLGRVFTPRVGNGSNPLLATQAHLHIHGGNQAGLNFTGGVRPWFQTG